MSQSHVIPAEVDDVRVTTMVDNAIDVLMASTDVAERYMLWPKWLPTVPSLSSGRRIKAERWFRERARWFPEPLLIRMPARCGSQGPVGYRADRRRRQRCVPHLRS